MTLHTSPGSGLLQAARGSLLLIVTRILARIGSIAYLAVLANFLPASEVGYYAYHLALALMLYTFIEFGQATLATRTLSPDNEPTATRLPSAFRVLGLTCLATLLLGVVCTLGWPVLRGHVIFLWMAMAFDALGALALTMARWRRRVGVIACAEMIRYWGPCCVFLVGASAFHVKAALPFMSVCIASGISVAYIWFVERVNLRQYLAVRATSVRSCLREGAALFVLALTAGVNNRLAVVMLRHLDGTATVAKYAAAYAFINGMMIAPYVFSYLALPDFARLARMNTDLQETALRQLTRGAVIAGLSAGLPLVVFSPFLLTILYGEAYLSGAPVLYFMGTALPFMFVSNLLGNILIAQKRQHFILVYMLLATVANLILNLVLIPRYSLAGAASATLCVEVLIFFAAAWSIRSAPLPLSLGRLALALPVCAGAPTAAFVFLSGTLGWWRAALLAAVLLLPCCMIAGLIRTRDFRALLQVLRPHWPHAS